MTGYGTAQFENDELSVSVEVRALNSKFLDIVTKLPKEASSFESDLRRILSDQLVRGKISLLLDLSKKTDNSGSSKINQEIFNQYEKQIRQVSKDLNIDDAAVFKAILSMPDVYEKEENSVESIDQDLIKKLTSDATAQCEAFRVSEGQSIEKAMIEFGKNISTRLAAIKLKDPIRIESIKNRINESLNGVNAAEKIDPNRFEQEIIYYLEKLDITEEFVRLENHLNFFKETLEAKESQGKKLGFISQEMGREINTIGSKANDSDIQKLVVEMKDELEKIKEQVLNIV